MSLVNRRFRLEHTNGWRAGPKLVVSDQAACAPIDYGSVEDTDKYNLTITAVEDKLHRVYLLQFWDDQRCVAHLVEAFEQQAAAESFARQQWTFRVDGESDPHFVIGEASEDFATKKYSSGIVYDYIAILHPSGVLQTASLNSAYEWELSDESR